LQYNRGGLNVSIDEDYAFNLSAILNLGEEVHTRNGTTKSLINQQITCHTAPLISIRRTAWKNALREFEWFLSGSNNIVDLHPSVQPWWKPWADEDGFLPFNYGYQFTKRLGEEEPANQIEYLINTIKSNAFSRRAVISTWDTEDMSNPECPLTNCHGTVIQAFERRGGVLDLSVYQRSADMMLGVPHNLIQYWAFLMYLCHVCVKDVGTFRWIGGDCHIYEEHFSAAREVVEGVERLDELDAPLPQTPKLHYKPSSDKFLADDFYLKGEYNPILKYSLPLIV